MLLPLRDSSTRIRRIAIGAAGLALVFAGMVAWWTWRVEAPAKPGRFTIDNFDAYVYYYPSFHYAFDELAAGRFPFWNPYQHCGAPFFALAQHLLLYPLNAFYLLLPTAAAMKATALLHLTLAVAFTAVLGRVLGLVWPAAVGAGIAFALSPAIASLVAAPHHLYGAVWMPLHLALAHLVLTGRRTLLWTVLLGAAIAAQYLGGYPMFTLFSLYLIGAYAVWWAVPTLWRGGVAAVARAAGALVGAGVLAGLLSAPQLLPALELAQTSMRSFDALDIDGVDMHYRGTQPRVTLLQTLLPTRDRAFQFLRMTPTPGWIVLGLAAAALFHRRQRRAVGFFVAVGLATYLIGLGRHGPLFELFYQLPTANFFRVTFRYFALTALPLAMLCGIGIDALWRLQRRPRLAIGGLVLLVALAVGLSLGPWLGIGALQPAVLPTTAAEPGLLHRLAAARSETLVLALWLALYLAVRGRARRAVVWALPVIVYWSLFVAHRNVAMLPDFDPSLHAMSSDVVAFLRARQGYARTHVSPSMLPVDHIRQPPVKSGMLYGLFVDLDRENVYARRYGNYTALLQRPSILGADQILFPNRPPREPQGGYRLKAYSPNLVLADLMGTRFIVEGRRTSFGAGAGTTRFPLLYSGSEARIFENRSALPRSFVVPHAEVHPEATALARLIEPGFDPLATVVLEEPPPIALGGPGLPGTATLVAYEPHRVVIDATTPSPAMLVLTDQYYPGWEATVDGQPAPILRADYLFRAVPLPAGTHRVEMRYVPHSFHRGLALAGTGLLAVVVLAAVRWRRLCPPIRRKPESGWWGGCSLLGCWLLGPNASGPLTANSLTASSPSLRRRSNPE
jgi:hypothetical protein